METSGKGLAGIGGEVADLLLVLRSGMRVLGKSGLFPADAEAFVDLALKLLD